MEPGELQEEYGLLIQEHGIWVAMVQGLWKHWADIIKQQPPRVECGEWIGVFAGAEDNMPMIVCPTSTEFQPCLGFYTIEILEKTSIYISTNILAPYLNKILEKVRKEGGLLWAIWHRSIAVNEWRGRVSANIEQRCVVCDSRARESIQHRFWECRSSQLTWEWGTELIDTLSPREIRTLTPIDSGATSENFGNTGSPGAGCPGHISSQTTHCNKLF